MANTVERKSPDWLTIAAIAVTVHTLATIVHEAFGHGGACLVVGCKPQMVTAMQFIGDDSKLGDGARRVIQAGGTIMNFVAAAIAMAVMRTRSNDKPAGPSWYFAWLFVTVNLLAATGYFLYSGVAGIGDWSDVIKGLQPQWMWRVLLAVIGGAGYYLVVRRTIARLGARLRGDPNARVRAANRFTWISYASIGLLALAAGAFEPGGALIVLISGVAASLGGTSGLAWGPQFLHDPKLATNTDPPLNAPRDWRWIAAGVISALFFVFAMGRGIPL